MKDKALLVITHGRFGIELVKSVEMIMGEQKDVATMGLCLEDDIEELRANAKKQVAKFQEEGKEVLIMVDILGGSPSNIGLQAVKEYGVTMITGTNMLMLISFFSDRDAVEMDELVEEMMQAGTDGIKKYQLSDFAGGVQ